MHLKPFITFQNKSATPCLLLRLGFSLIKFVMKLLNYPFGILFLAIGFVNTFWGNDPLFVLFILVLALIYFPPIQSRVEEKINFRLKEWMKIVLGGFIIWASLGVGELFDKVDLMLNSFK